MDTTVDVVGVYRIESHETVHLVEILVNNSKGVFDLSEFTQEISDQQKENWQVPWDEKILDIQGEKILADYFSVKEKPELWMGNVRIAFFFHYLDFSKPLITPFGLVTLSNESLIPNRLAEIEYESPD